MAKLGRFPAQRVDAVHQSPVRSRFEIKYFLDFNTLTRFREKVRQLLEADPNGAATGGYLNHSIYFDSPKARNYVEKIEGLSLRTKPRLRIYREIADLSSKAFFLELKNRSGSVVSKERLNIDRPTALNLLDRFKLLDFDSGIESSVFDKFCYLVQRYDLRPMMSVLYHREAYFSPHYPGLRVTFDKKVTASSTSSIDPDVHFFWPVFPVNRMIVEIKYNNHFPGLISRVVQHLEMQQVSISKYVESVAAAGSYKWKSKP